MVADNRFVQAATSSNCLSTKTRNDLLKQAVRKDGETKNGADKNLLFPRALIRAVLTRDEMLWVLRCQCDLCSRLDPEPMFTTDLPDRVMQDWDRHLAFAILVYMGATFAARLFFSRGLGTTNFNLQEALEKLSTELLENADPIEYCSDFSKVFESTRLLFEPPFFQKQNVWSIFTDDHNFPFLFQKQIRNGLPSSFGTLYSFWLHKDFCAGIPSIDIPRQPEDRTIDPDKQFPQCKLARKELVGPEPDFKSERSILEFISKEDHPHLIKLYFWYQRGHYFNLVFPYYPASLQDVLVKGWLPRQPPATPERFKASLLRHWLWEQILNVVEGLERVHNPKNYQDWLPNIQAPLIGGHFDIKPANILIDHNGQLVLADFGQAQIKNMSHGGGTAFTGPGGTLTYRPPPLGNNNDRDTRKWHRSYDVWSMACVMLETVHFILGGIGQVATFIAEREIEEPLNMRSPAFWKDTSNGPVLKECVQASLTQLKSKNDRYLTMVVKLLQRMFNVSAKDRGTIMECLEDLSNDNLTDQWPWKDEDEVSIGGYHTTRSLRKLTVRLDYTSTDESYKSIECSLHVFRDISVEHRAKYRFLGRGEAASYNLLGDNVRMVLDFDQNDRNHMLSERGVRSREVLKPLTYFQQKSHDPPQSPDSRTCAFLDLHRKLTLNFPKSRDYYHFQAAITHQRVYEVLNASISKCWISYKKAMPGRNLLKYGSGRVEIWKQLSEEEYHNEFVARKDRSNRASLRAEDDSRASSERYIAPISPTNQGRPTTSNAVAVHHPKSAPMPRRLVLYLETEKIILTTILNTIILVKNRSEHIDPKSSLCLSFIPHLGPPVKHKYFELGVFEGSEHGRERAQNDPTSLHETCPGIPLDPKVLADKETTRVEWLEIEFTNPQGKTSFINLYNQLFKDKTITT